MTHRLVMKVVKAIVLIRTQMKLVIIVINDVINLIINDVNTALCNHTMKWAQLELVGQQ